MIWSNLGHVLWLNGTWLEFLGHGLFLNGKALGLSNGPGLKLWDMPYSRIGCDMKLWDVSHGRIGGGVKLTGYDVVCDELASLHVLLQCWCV